MCTFVLSETQDPVWSSKALPSHASHSVSITTHVVPFREYPSVTGFIVEACFSHHNDEGVFTLETS